MIDIKILRNEKERVKKNCERRGCEVDIDKLYEIDKECRKLIGETEEKQALRNTLSKECRTNPQMRVKVKALKGEIKEMQDNLDALKKKMDLQMALLPNFLADDVPDGDEDEDNALIREVGIKPTFDFEPLDHQALGEKLDIIDTARGAKVAQSGFYYWKGKGAELASSLFFWTQQELIKKGYTLFFTPCVAKEETLFGTGYLPFFEDQTYKLENEDLALIGTSEQTLIGYHANEKLLEKDLPALYTAFSPCFRTEAGSYGKESRGIFRVHQFHKVEQVIFCLPEESEKYHEFCLDAEEDLLKKLKLPYRVVNVCVGDMGAPGYKKYDTEAWFAGYNGYREVTSNTNLTDFQTRRLNVKYEDADGKKDFLHTISATAVTDRVVCAILENNQRADGSVAIPEVLSKYTGFSEIKAE
ncbi:MAG: serine--tRNA ligase [Verrucomicrobiota bacterium]|nr:serine--tRNA ligase [Verrucomicrobiota bacterium]